MQYIQGTTAQSQPMKIKENTDICNITYYSSPLLFEQSNYIDCIFFCYLRSLVPLSHVSPVELWETIIVKQFISCWLNISVMNFSDSTYFTNSTKIPFKLLDYFSVEDCIHRTTSEEVTWHKNHYVGHLQIPQIFILQPTVYGWFFRKRYVQ